MSFKLNRRRFCKDSLLASASAAVVAPAAGLAAPAEPLAAPGPGPVVAGAKGALPAGKIGKLTVSRLVSGGNLISGWAHSRDLHYVPALMRAYNTEQKVMDTLQLMEEHGINTIIADPRKKPMDIFARYWKERGGKIQWIAEGHPEVDDWQTNLKQSIDFGAAGVYVQGVKSDRFYKDGRLELLGKCVQFIKAQGVPAGVGAHKLEVIAAAELQDLGAQFYVKTLHHTHYWSCRRPDQQADVIENPADNYWDLEPDKTIAFMQEVPKPWIAFKVLAAGAIRPESGFKYAFENGADFICVGMFDFQVEQNAALVRTLLQQTQNRQREWMG
jgi:hypothetical protein